MTPNINIDQQSINTIRFLAADAVQAANSGHPGLPMGAAPMAYVLWTQHLQHSPQNPSWANRDRFILSGGHGSMLLYALLHLTGYDLPLDELRNFRQWGSRTPGHPEAHLTPGVETTTGPLGQGFANGVGMAMAEAHLAARFNKPDAPAIIDHYTYAIVTDGDLMEGVASEAASLAGHLKLGKLIYLYDDNHISIDGSTDLAFTENRVARFAAYGWHTQTVADGNDQAALNDALKVARKVTDKPSLIAIRTIIGFGAPNKQDTSKVHGEPLGEEELAAAKRNLGWPEDARFLIPGDVLEHMRTAIEEGAEHESSWEQNFAAYREQYPAAAAEYERIMRGELPPDWQAQLPTFEPDDKGMATRNASGTVINALAPVVPELIGGSADLAPSNKTLINGEPDFQAGNYGGRNLRFGVREHAMGSILNGLAIHGGLIPYGATFLIFYDYMRPPIRLAALSGFRPIIIFTHDSIGLGEDGPTHQAVEQLAGLRAVPNLICIRPGDANEVVEAWRMALQNDHGPTCLILTRQSMPTLDRSKFAPAAGLQQGAYILSEAEGSEPEVILIGTGSEVSLALTAQNLLLEMGVRARVVSMPSWELFALQSQEYRDSVLLPNVRARVAVEAGSSFGWHRWVGDGGAIVAVDRFGASAPWQEIYEQYGLTAENVKSKALQVLGRSG